MRFLNRFKSEIKVIAIEDKFKNISYSQCGEDLIVKHVFQALNIENM